MPMASSGGSLEQIPRHRICLSRNLGLQCSMYSTFLRVALSPLSTVLVSSSSWALHVQPSIIAASAILQAEPWFKRPDPLSPQVSHTAQQVPWVPTAASRASCATKPHAPAVLRLCPKPGATLDPERGSSPSEVCRLQLCFEIWRQAESRIILNERQGSWVPSTPELHARKT